MALGETPAIFIFQTAHNFWSHHLIAEDKKALVIALKNKLRHTCDKYSQTGVPCKYHTIIDNLCRNKDLAIMKQDKGKGAVSLHRTVYIDKCLSILNTQQFEQLENK